MPVMRLSKHHAQGNDFLVLVDLAGEHPVDGALARVLCDRRTGVGADGFIEVCPAGEDADVAMALWNADGNRAEMSGNGIRCLAQAVLDAGAVAGPDVVVATDAGPRVVRTRPGGDPASLVATVDMGTVTLGDDAPERVAGPVRRARHAGCGNPHLVLQVDEPGTVDVAGVAAAASRQTPGGANVELVCAGPRADELTMRVYERGVGETPACGTGACAAAAVARAWGLVDGPLVRVRMPGGTAEVHLGDTVTLTGPSVRIATIEVERG